MVRQNAEQGSTMTTEQRYREVSRILAAGVLRLRARCALIGCGVGSSAPAKPGNSTQDSLEVLQKTVLSVHTGERFSRPQNQE
jgi:hypothetical protein